MFKVSDKTPWHTKVTRSDFINSSTEMDSQACKWENVTLINVF